MTHLDFPLADGAYRYRPLRRGLRGWDIFALQTGVLGLGERLPRYGQDGDFGGETASAVKSYQETRGLVKDGIAGIATQRQIGHELAARFSRAFDLPKGVPLGHVEHESSFQLGNHTPPYENASRDCGVVQRNTQYTPLEDGFDTYASIEACARRVAEKYDAYRDLDVVSDERALHLACGSWNAPSWTDTLARRGSLSASQRSHIEAYIEAVTVYLA